MFIYDLQLVCKVRVSIWNAHTHFLLVYLPPPPSPSSSLSSHTVPLSAPTPKPPSFLLCSVVFSTLGRISRGNIKGDSKKVSWVKKVRHWMEGVCDWREPDGTGSKGHRCFSSRSNSKSRFWDTALSRKARWWRKPMKWRIEVATDGKCKITREEMKIRRVDCVREAKIKRLAGGQNAN